MKLLKILPTLLLLIVSSSAFSQDIEDKKEKIKALKVAFITEELNLTSAEASKFWPIYNAFDMNQFQLRQQKMKAFQQKIKTGAIDNMSEKEAASFLSQMENTEDELYQLRKKLNSDLRSVISAVKIIKLKKAEDDFNRKLLKQYRDKRQKK